MVKVEQVNGQVLMKIVEFKFVVDDKNVVFVVFLECVDFLVVDGKIIVIMMVILMVGVNFVGGSMWVDIEVLEGVMEKDY